VQRCVPERQHIFLIEFFYSYTIIHSYEKPKKYVDPILAL